MCMHLWYVVVCVVWYCVCVVVYVYDVLCVGGVVCVGGLVCVVCTSVCWYAHFACECADYRRKLGVPSCHAQPCPLEAESLSKLWFQFG